MKDLNGAFPDTPEYVRSAIHMGLRRARKRRALKRGLFAAASVAAVLAVMFGAFSLAVSARRFPGGLPRTPNPGPLAHGQATVEPTPMPTTLATQKPVPAAARTQQPTPQPPAFATTSPVAARTQRPTPQPTVLATASPMLYYVERTEFPTPMPAAYSRKNASGSAVTLVPEMSEAASSYAAERIVYSTKGGKYYHSDWSCSGMLGAAARPISDAEALGQAACPICMPTEPTVWTTRAGAYYHDSQTCSGMRYSVSITESEATASGMKLCPVCQATRARELPADLYSTDRGTYYHADPACSGMLGAVWRTEEEVRRLGQMPCPICIG